MLNNSKYYHCPECGKDFRWFQDNPGVRIVCGKPHANECCHVMEEEVIDA